MTEQETGRPVIPLIPLRNMVMFPGVSTTVRIGRPRSLAALREGRQRDGRLVLVAQRDSAVDRPGPSDLSEVGVIGRIRRDSGGGQSGGRNVLIDGLERCRLADVVQQEAYLAARVEPLPEEPGEVPADLRRRVRELFTAGGGPGEVLAQMSEVPGFRPDYFIAFALDMPVERKQMLLEERDPEQRYRMLVPLLNRERKIAAAGERIREDLHAGINDEQRRRYLEERRRRVEKALAELTGEEDDLVQLRQRLDETDLPEQARAEADRELARLSRMPTSSPEFSLTVDYLEWLGELPWNRSTEAVVDLPEARRVLDRDHYDREEVKERILEYLSVRKLRPESEGAFLCFVGAPGVGKTSLGRSIAEATGRKFCRISLGGIRDEADIRGHRRTYIGALPGRIMRALRDAGVNNPVLMLDELDKIQPGIRGNPASALLEVMDPEQNAEFVDNYLAVPFDLSRIMFIGTANTTDTIPPVLLDRLEVIELAGYSTDEKVAIARQYLVPKQLTAAGLQDEQVEFEEDSIEFLIEGYTREVGVRGLERQIGAICRKLARERVGGHWCYQSVTARRVGDMLGPRRYRTERAERGLRPGVCPTLAVSPAGGRLLTVEVDRVPGEGKLIVTGRAREALRESAQIAFSFCKSRAERLGWPSQLLERSDFHVHFPASAAASEAASVGLAIVLGFASALTGRPVPDGTAALGEIALSGRLRKVESLPERLAASDRAEIDRLILPELNQPDVEDFLRSRPHPGAELTYVSSIEEAITAVFAGAAAPRGEVT